MKLLSFEAGGRRGFGVVRDGRVAPLATPAVTTLRQALESWGMEGLRKRADAARAELDVGQIRWLPPIVDPDKILCVGMNYRGHAEEAGLPLPAHPAIFVRFPGSQVGHGEPVLRPAESVQFDYEAELAVIIGRRARRVPEDHAMEHVAGFACFAENSVRDWQKHAGEATPGKNFRASGAFGPWMVTPDEAGPPETIRVIGRLNGCEVQNDTLDNLIFGVPRLIAYLSTFADLLPGDVIVTGSPAGVGFRRKPPLWLKPGDVFEVECSGVGLLRNPVSDDPA